MCHPTKCQKYEFYVCDGTIPNCHVWMKRESRRKGEIRDEGGAEAKEE
jgi:hypothetical protein